MFSEFNRTHQLEDFKGFVASTVAVSTSHRDMPPTIDPVDLQQTELAPDEFIALLIQNGDDFERPIGTANARYPSRSEVVFKVSISLVRRGFPPEIVAGLLLNANHRISESILEKGDPQKYAWRQVMNALTVVEEGWPETLKDGTPKSSYRNALRCLVLLEVQLRYDLFRIRITADGHHVQQFAGDISDDMLAILRRAATERFGFDPGKQHIADAAHSLALEHCFHPIRDYLDSLRWDGVERLPKLLHRYFGAEDNDINAEFSKIILVAAVRRVRSPGAKFDTMLVLEGPQGSGKSTAIKILAGDENFSDQAIIGLDQKAQGELVQGVWLYEIAELSGLRHTDVNDLKSFMSRDTDRFRAAYARTVTSYRRQCVFIGTTNDEVYLKDETGNRRFWPVKTTEIDLEALRQDRDQLWAEAAHLEAQFYPITLPEAFWEEARALQAARLPQHRWLDVLDEISGSVIVNGEERVSTKILFGEGNLNISPAQRRDYHHKELASVMRELGWQGPTALKIDGKTQRGYTRPAGESGQDDTPQF